MTTKEIPVIPQILAEIIKKYKENEDSLGELLASVEHTSIKYYHGLEKHRAELNNLYSITDDICEIIARAWLDGYTVYKEVSKMTDFEKAEESLSQISYRIMDYENSGLLTEKDLIKEICKELDKYFLEGVTE